MNTYVYKTCLCVCVCVCVCVRVCVRAYESFSPFGFVHREALIGTHAHTHTHTHSISETEILWEMKVVVTCTKRLKWKIYIDFILRWNIPVHCKLVTPLSCL